MMTPELSKADFRPVPLSSYAEKPPISGWLIFPAFGALVAPFYNAYYLVDYLRQYGANLTGAGKVFYAITAFGLFGIQIVSILVFIWLLKRDRRFPIGFVGMLAANVIFAGGVLIALASVFSYSPTAEDSKELIRAIAGAIIWIPYILLSKRVRYTFYGEHFPQFEPSASNATAFGALKSDQAKVAEPKTPDPARKRAHRIGVFATLISTIVFCFAILLVIFQPTAYSGLGWPHVLAIVGFFGILFSYVVSRLWYWAAT